MRIHRSVAAAFLLSGALLRPAAAEPPASATETAAAANDSCLGCHSDPELSLTLGDGAVRPLAVDPNQLARSVHGGELRCTECHPGMEELPHPERKFPDTYAMRAALGESCKTCHEKDAAHAKDGVH